MVVNKKVLSIIIILLMLVPSFNPTIVHADPSSISVIENTGNATELANSLINVLRAGEGSDGLTNVTGEILLGNTTSGTSQFGTFSGGINANLGFDEGIILSTGKVTEAVLSASERSTDVDGSGYANLEPIADDQISYDAAVLKIDFTPDGDQVTFFFRFASEEWPTVWSSGGSYYYDAFAFFVNGTEQVNNLAKLPNGDLISVRNIYPANVPGAPEASGSNVAYYYNNISGGSQTDFNGGRSGDDINYGVAYNGLIPVLSFTADVNPGVNNTLYIAISDMSDGNYDSAVFIQANTFRVNKVPTLDNPLSDQGAAVDRAFSYQFPENTFSDGDAEDNLTYTATLSDGSSLPGWLSFNTSTRTFSGNPGAGDVGSVTVKVTATDDAGSTVSDSFILSVTANTPPTITGAVPGQAVNDKQTITPFAAINIADAEGDNVAVTVTLDTQEKGVLTNLGNFVDNGDGSYTLPSIDLATAQSQIRALVFEPAENRVKPGNTETTTFSISVSDGIDTTTEVSTTVQSTSANDSPTDITLDNTQVNQSKGIDGEVGTLATTDVDVDDAYVYSLVSGLGDTDNEKFNINSNILRVNDGSTLNGGIYTARVRVTDLGGAYFEEAFNVAVIDDLSPIFDNGPNLANVGQESIDLAASLNEEGTIYYVVLADGDIAPTANEVKNGVGHGGVSPISSGSREVSIGDFSHIFNIQELDPLTNYDVYIIAEDDTSTPNLMTAPIKLDVTTAYPTYTVSFASNGGSEVASVTADYDTVLSEPVAPTKEGYNFAGWYKDAGLTNEWDFAVDKVPAQDITLYAKWIIPQERIKMTATPSSVEISDSDTFSQLFSLTITNDTVAERVYAADLSLGGVFYNLKLGEVDNTNTTVTAAVYGNLDSTGVGTITFRADKLLNATSPLSANIMVTEKDIPTYTVTFLDYNGNSLKTEVIASGGAATAPANPARPGYTFTGWDKGFSNIISDLTVTARYSVNQYTVSFVSNGGSEIAPVTADYDTVLTEPAAPAKEGYYFAGWYKDAGLTNEWDFAVDKVPAQDIALSAKWTISPDRIRIVATPNSVEISDSFSQIFSLNITNDTVADRVYAADLSLSGVFNDLNIGEVNNTNTTVTAAVYGNLSRTGIGTITFSADKLVNATSPLAANIMVTEKDVTTYTVTFLDYNGNILKTEVIASGGAAAAPVNPARSGYTFTGWDKDFSNVISDLIITATYKKNSSSSSSSGTSPTSAKSSQSGTFVTVNGEKQRAGVEVIKEENGQKTVEVMTDADALEEKIEEVLKEQENTGNFVKNVIEIPVASKDANRIKGILAGDIVKKMDENNFTVSINTAEVDYVIPAKEIGIEQVAARLKVNTTELKKIEVEVHIEKVSESQSQEFINNAQIHGYEVVFPPVEFKVIAKTQTNSGETITTEVSKFSKYVQRVMLLPEGIDPNKITTGIVYNSDGTFSHIPTEVFEKDGKYYAKLNSLTNSNYSVIWNPITVATVENHWAKESVNDLASRLVIKNPSTFKPEEAITRGDFAEYITKAIGIYRTGVAKASKFSDVELSNMLADAIEIATDYGIIVGYPDGTFKPDAQISRQEAMAMYSRAMETVGLAAGDTTKIEKYRDKDEIAEWAFAAVKKTVGAGVFNGRSFDTINPKGTFTYAEAATAIRNLLIAAELINK